jgi:hypothetical protein
MADTLGRRPALVNPGDARGSGIRYDVDAFVPATIDVANRPSDDAHDLRAAGRG